MYQPMNQIEMFRASQTELRQRLAIIDGSGLTPRIITPEHNAEADMIRRELARRIGCAA